MALSRHPGRPRIRTDCWCRFLTLLLACVSASTVLAASENPGLYLYLRADAARSQLGFVTRLDSTVGYRLGSYFAVDAGLPIYLVRPSESALASASVASVNGIGNARVAGHVILLNPAVNYLGSLSVTVPTGDEKKGLSTGRATYDWNNHFDRSFGRLTPFADAGIANTVTDTPFFIRPFTSRGFVTHLSGGARLRLFRAISVGAMGYVIRPSGEQTVVSRVRKTANTNSPGRSAGRGRGVFETNPTTVGPAEIARDRGGSVWLDVNPSRFLDFQAGFTRSSTYSLNTVFVGVGVNVGSLIRRDGW